MLNKETNSARKNLVKKPIACLRQHVNAKKEEKDANATYAHVSQEQCANAKEENHFVSANLVLFASVQKAKKDVSVKLVQSVNANLCASVNLLQSVSANQGKKDANVSSASVSLAPSVSARTANQPVYVTLTKCASVHLGKRGVSVLSRNNAAVNLCAYASLGQHANAQKEKKDVNVTYAHVSKAQCASAKEENHFVSANLMLFVSVKKARKDVSAKLVPSVNANPCASVNLVQFVSANQGKKDASVSSAIVSLALTVNARTANQPVYAILTKCASVHPGKRGASVLLRNNAAVNLCAYASLGQHANAKKEKKDANVTYAHVRKAQFASAKEENHFVSANLMLFVSVKKARKDVSAKLVPNVNANLCASVNLAQSVSANQGKKDANAHLLHRNPKGMKLVKNASAHLILHVSAELQKRSQYVIVNLGKRVNARKEKKDANVSCANVSPVLSVNVRTANQPVYVILTKCASVRLGKRDASVLLRNNAAVNLCAYASLGQRVNAKKEKKDANVTYALVRKAQCASAKEENHFVSANLMLFVSVKKARKDVSAKLVPNVNANLCASVNLAQSVSANQGKKDANAHLLHRNPKRRKKLVKNASAHPILHAPAELQKRSQYVIVNLEKRVNARKEKKDANVLCANVSLAHSVNARTANKPVHVTLTKRAFVRLEKRGASVPLRSNAAVNLLAYVSLGQHANAQKEKKVANVIYAHVNQAQYANAEEGNDFAVASLVLFVDVKQAKKDASAKLVPLVNASRCAFVNLAPFANASQKPDEGEKKDESTRTAIPLKPGEGEKKDESTRTAIPLKPGEGEKKDESTRTAIPLKPGEGEKKEESTETTKTATSQKPDEAEKKDESTRTAIPLKPGEGEKKEDSTRTAIPLKPGEGVKKEDSTRTAIPLKPGEGEKKEDSTRTAIPLKPGEGEKKEDSTRTAIPLKPGEGEKKDESTRTAIPLKPGEGEKKDESTRTAIPLKPGEGEKKEESTEVEVKVETTNTATSQKPDEAEKKDESTRTAIPLKPGEGEKKDESTRTAIPLKPGEGEKKDESTRTAIPLKPGEGEKKEDSTRTAIPLKPGEGEKKEDSTRTAIPLKPGEGEKKEDSTRTAIPLKPGEGEKKEDSTRTAIPLKPGEGEKKEDSTRTAIPLKPGEGEKKEESTRTAIPLKPGEAQEQTHHECKCKPGTPCTCGAANSKPVCHCQPGTTCECKEGKEGCRCLTCQCEPGSLCKCKNGKPACSCSPDKVCLCPPGKEGCKCPVEKQCSCKPVCQCEPGTACNCTEGKEGCKCHMCSCEPGTVCKCKGGKPFCKCDPSTVCQCQAGKEGCQCKLDITCQCKPLCSCEPGTVCQCKPGKEGCQCPIPAEKPEGKEEAHHECKCQPGTTCTCGAANSKPVCHCQPGAKCECKEGKEGSVNLCANASLGQHANAQKEKRDVSVIYVHVSQAQCANAKEENHFVSAILVLFASVKQEKKDVSARSVSLVNANLCARVNLVPSASANLAKRDVNARSLQRNPKERKKLIMNASANPALLAHVSLKIRNRHVIVNLEQHVNARMEKKDASVSSASVSLAPFVSARTASQPVCVILTRCASAHLGKKGASVLLRNNAAVNLYAYASPGQHANAQKEKRDVSVIYVHVSQAQCANAKEESHFVSAILVLFASVKQEKKDVSAKSVLLVNANLCASVNQEPSASANLVKKDANAQLLHRILKEERKLITNVSANLVLHVPVSLKMRNQSAIVNLEQRANARKEKKAASVLSASVSLALSVNVRTANQPAHVTLTKCASVHLGKKGASVLLRNNAAANLCAYASLGQHANAQKERKVVNVIYARVSQAQCANAKEESHFVSAILVQFVSVKQERKDVSAKLVSLVNANLCATVNLVPPASANQVKRDANAQLLQKNLKARKKHIMNANANPVLLAHVSLKMQNRHVTVNLEQNVNARMEKKDASVLSASVILALFVSARTASQPVCVILTRCASAHLGKKGASVLLRNNAAVNLYAFASPGQHASAQKEKRDVSVIYVHVSQAQCANAKEENHSVSAIPALFVSVKQERKDVSAKLVSLVNANLCATVNLVPPASANQVKRDANAQLLHRNSKEKKNLITNASANPGLHVPVSLKMSNQRVTVNLEQRANARKEKKDVNVISAHVSQARCANAKVENRSVSAILVLFVDVKQAKKDVSAKLVPSVNANLCASVNLVQSVSATQKKKDASVQSVYATLASFAFASLGNQDVFAILPHHVNAKQVRKDASARSTWYASARMLRTTKRRVATFFLSY
ncbi:hypothetical protein ANCCEY_09944 [Ancylostoma ceylanicum]|uniref:Uncharacterized protein n=1 Tax=Ancylostoma ceylanicum TaxID=53326 RepID=A0A0D6LFW1_9BILA|nr:hypothetical protein ANCCEY_09944 [Ancylostoma ceylanicum]